MRSIAPSHFRWYSVTFEGRFGDVLASVTLDAQFMRDLLAIAKFIVGFTYSKASFVTAAATVRNSL